LLTSAGLVLLLLLTLSETLYVNGDGNVDTSPDLAFVQLSVVVAALVVLTVTFPSRAES
jgi:hypothetical protein